MECIATYRIVASWQGYGFTIVIFLCGCDFLIFLCISLDFFNDFVIWDGFCNLGWIL